MKGDHYIKSLKKRQGLLIVIIAALTLEVLSGVQYYYTHRLMEQELEKRAELDLTMKALLIKSNLNDAEDILNNHMWRIQDNLDKPDSVYTTMKRMVKLGVHLLGGGVGFEPYYYPEKGQFLGDVLMGLSSVTGGIRFVEAEDFQSAMDVAKDDPQKARQLSSLLAYQDMAHGQKTADVERDNDYTTQVLYRLDFAWSPTSWDYVERMLAAIGGFGFFE